MKIDLEKANFIGEGSWVKNSAWQVYELEGKYYKVIVADNMNKELIEETITEIKENDVDLYIL